MLSLLFALTLGCGQERWAVKTLTDHEASRVYLLPEKSTVAQLTGLAPPAYSDTRPRNVHEEETVYEVTVYVLGLKAEEDGDLHVVIADSPRAQIRRDREASHGSRETMVVELPSKECTAGSIHALAMQEARSALLRAVGKEPAAGRFKLLRKPVRLLFRGVGFFDKDHGQTGRAQNALELHPVLAVKQAPL
jgi:hypothetical protein